MLGPGDSAANNLAEVPDPIKLTFFGWKLEEGGGDKTIIYHGDWQVERSFR